MGVDHNILTAYVGLHPSTLFPGSSLLLLQVVHPGNDINWLCLIITSRVAASTNSPWASIQEGLLSEGFLSLRFWEAYFQ